MNFEYKVHKIKTLSLDLEYFQVPWDTEIFGDPVAEISHIAIKEPAAAKLDFKSFLKWLGALNIQLCSCRLPQAMSSEMMFLQEHEFRFIELHYEPKLIGLEKIPAYLGSFKVVEASPIDRDFLAEISGINYLHGRFHNDVRLGHQIGNKRYRIWMQNSFTRVDQTVLKCMSGSQIAAYFVVEYPAPNHCHWSLVGMTPEFLGRGFAKDVWRSVMDWHREDGIEVITTGISSHNSPVLNLYVSLGFQFPHPDVTYHWMPDHTTPA